MGPAAALLIFGGALSFAAGAASGFWLDAQLRRRPGGGPDRYRMVLHKEALWSSFLCFAVAGWIERFPGGPAGQLAIAAALVLTGWGAIGQYLVVARAGIRDAYAEPVPALARALGAVAMIANLAAVAALAIGAALLVVRAL